MSLVPWKNKGRSRDDSPIEPYDVFDRFRSEMDRVFDRFLGGSLGETGLAHAWGPSVDVTETATDITVRAEVPGLDPKELEITLSGNVLTLGGEKKETCERKDENYYHCERKFGSFRRSITLPAAVDSEKVTADHKNGVVTITLKKRESAMPKRISVQSGK